MEKAHKSGKMDHLHQLWPHQYTIKFLEFKYLDIGEMMQQMEKED